jgi:hypothetical protein
MATPGSTGAGRSAEQEATRRAAVEARPARGLGSAFLIAAGAGLVAALAVGALASPVAGAAAGLAVAGLAWSGARRRPDLRSGAWAHGAAGERMTAECLAPLRRRGFVFLHDRTVGGPSRDNGGNIGNIDHVVIGPPGVFAVETKYLSGVVHVGWRLRANGRRLDGVIDQAWSEASAVERVLGVEVMPLLCIHGARIRRHWWRLPLVEGVWVGSGPALARYLRRQHPLFSAEDVADLADEAQRVLVPAP